VERVLAAQSLEHGFAFAANGHLLFRVTSGRPDQIVIPTALRRQLTAAVFTHNHPGGHSLSEQDLEFAMMSDLVEIRAVTSRARYAIRPPDQGWSYMMRLALRRTVEREKALLVRQLRQQIARGQIDANLAELEFEHRLWSRVAATGLLYYTAEPWAEE
jgi:hypothetical protein